MDQMRLHMDPRAGPDLHRLIAECDLETTLDHLNDRGNGGCVVGQLLTLVEGEEDDTQALVAEHDAAECAVLRYLHFVEEVLQHSEGRFVCHEPTLPLKHRADRSRSRLLSGSSPSPGAPW